jgi:hypothetical protein
MLNRREIKTRLEALARQLGGQVIYGELNYPGGYCRSKGRFYIIISDKLALEEKLRLLCEGVSQLPWEETELPAEIQNLLVRKDAGR